MNKNGIIQLISCILKAITYIIVKLKRNITLQPLIAYFLQYFLYIVISIHIDLMRIIYYDISYINKGGDDILC